MTALASRSETAPRDNGRIDRGQFAGALFAWFAEHRRDLAFRRTRDPYAVLVSEVMLQQTQALRVGPAWQAFLARFPTLKALAGASPAEVIRAWGTLGYNGRAVRLRRAAQAILEGHGGAVPEGLTDLAALPGIGPYTARAVAATAFCQPVAPLDTNVGRVIRRLHRLGPPAGSASPSTGSAPPANALDSAVVSPAVLQRMADDLVDPTRTADWTHAMMDIGALVCGPRAPRCGECPLAAFCRSAGLWTRDARACARAGRRPAARRGRTVPTTPFPATRRWLRGRIVQQLREQRRGRWVRLDDAIGVHPREAVLTALEHLEGEGLVERDRSGRARLPLARRDRPGARVA